MPYYVWKRNGKIVAHDYSQTARPAPAIKISNEEAKELGIYVPQFSEIQLEGSNTNSEPSELDFVVTAYRQGVNEAE